MQLLKNTKYKKIRINNFKNTKYKKNTNQQFQKYKYKKNTKNMQPKNTKSELQGLENTTGWFCIFFVFWFLISKSEHGVGSLAYF